MEWVTAGILPRRIEALSNRSYNTTIINFLDVNFEYPMRKAIHSGCKY